MTGLTRRLCYAESRKRPRRLEKAWAGGGSGLRKMLVGEVPCLSSQARYYLLEEDGNFGVQIELEGEEASVRDLSPSRQKVQDLAEALIRGTVTPVGLRDVVDDWLLE